MRRGGVIGAWSTYQVRWEMAIIFSLVPISSLFLNFVCSKLSTKMESYDQRYNKLKFYVFWVINTYFHFNVSILFLCLMFVVTLSPMA